ncbi:MAG: hypothetical protein AB7S39_19550 [Gemmatimonadales bacterium]
MSTLPSVHAIVPLALLEAIRNLDTPLNDGLPAELAQEAFTKRLGLSSTVAAQIARYREMADKHTPVSRDEAVQVFRLVGRRSDATLVYSDAGRRAARYAGRIPGSRPGLVWRVLPRSMRRRAGERSAARTLRRVFRLDLKRDPAGLSMALPETLAIDAGMAGAGCYFYSALAAETLRLAAGFEGTMVHERCRSRGDEACRWKAADAEQNW